MDQPCMPYGKHVGQPIADLPSGFLLWWSSQQVLGKKFPDTLRAILAELRKRFSEGDRIEVELFPNHRHMAERPKD